jgi:hypothetical protein
VITFSLLLGFVFIGVLVLEIKIGCKKNNWSNYLFSLIKMIKNTGNKSEDF